MKNILILYNPYYQEDVIEQHLEILKEFGYVAFGKVKSKLKDMIPPNKEILENIYNNVSKNKSLQLFLTDYNSMYVANVIAVKKEKTKIIKAPQYYDELEVEQWYIFDDIRLLASNDFPHIRDNLLANFKAINYNNHTYAVYGNSYVYPMQVTMKNEINYFEKDNEDFKFFFDIFKSKEQIKIKQNLIDFNFGEKIFYSLTANTQDNIISAEVEYMQNKQNPLYDFSSIVMKYSKAIEHELYIFMKILFSYLMSKNIYLKNIPYSIQGNNFVFEDILEHKANYGTYKYLMKTYEIKDAINQYIENSSFKYFLFKKLINFISIMQEVRNESIHGSMTSFKDCNTIRETVIGIGINSILSEINQYKSELNV
ncbi:MAG: HP0729 family protein [Arcobacteraceae bacterium]